MKTLLPAGATALLAAGLALNANARPDTQPPAAAPIPPAPSRSVSVNGGGVSDGPGAEVVMSGPTATMVINRRPETTQQRQRSSENVYTVLSKANAGATTQLERALVIRASKTDAKTIAAMEEDLRVMSRILHKALHSSGDDGQQHAMGINMVSVSDGSRARNIQIEGFGAIFLLNVSFPLVGPDPKPDDTATKEPTNSTWDQARREVYGHTDDSYMAPTLAAFAAKPKFDAKRVEKLKDALVEALKNAANIRHLAPDESVTVVVNSGASGTYDYDMATVFQIREKLASAAAEQAATPQADTNPALHEWKMEPGGQATMTIRAKKSDIDLFAKDKLTLEEFRKKATILIY